MTGMEMAAYIRFIVMKEAMEKARAGSILGASDRKLNKKKVVLSGDIFSEDPGTCWWIVTDKHADKDDIIIKEVAKTVFTVATGLTSAALGGHVVQGIGETLKSSGKVAGRINSIGGAAARMDSAFTGVMRACVAGTPAEFAVELDHCLGGGAAAFTKKLNGEMILSLKMYGKSVIDVMSSIERGNSSKQNQIATTRLYCNSDGAGCVYYRISMDHKIVKITHTEMEAETRVLPSGPPPGPDAGTTVVVHT